MALPIRRENSILNGPSSSNTILNRPSSSSTNNIRKALSIAHADGDESDDDKPLNPLTFFDRSNKEDDLLQYTSSSFTGVKKDGSVVVPQPIKLDTSKLLKTIYNNDSNSNSNSNVSPRVFTSIRDTNYNAASTSSSSNVNNSMKGCVSKIGMIGLNNHLTIVKNVKELTAIRSMNNYKKENDNINNMFNRKNDNMNDGIKAINTNNASEYTMVGNVLVNVNKLNANSTNINNQKVVIDKVAVDNARMALESNKLKRKKEIDDLLNRKSSHSEEASDEAFDSFSKKLKTLENREKKSDKENAITSVHVKAFHCDKCNLMTEENLPMCRQKKHPITMVRTIKRFFECTNCFRKESTIGDNARLPKIKCKCGHFSWNSSGKNGSSASRDGKGTGIGIHNQPLLLASSESFNYSKNAADKTAMLSISRKYE